MNEHADCDSYLSRLRWEHNRLELLSKSIYDRFHRSRESSWYPTDRPEIAARLSALKDELSKHIDEEDQGGCVDEAVARLPSLSFAARRIHEESDELIERLEQVMQVVEFGSREDAGRAFEEFAGHLRLHEQHEEQLSEKGFNSPPFQD